MKGRSLLLGLGLGLAACGAKNNSVRLELQGRPLAACDDAKLEDLHDGDQQAGFRIVCATPRWSLVVNEDTRTRKDLTIDRLDLTGELNRAEHPDLDPSGSVSLLAAIASEEPGGPECASAKALGRKTGEPRIPRGGGGAIETGTYSLELAKPCGRLVIHAAAK
jgi:hypothetical protein